MPSNRFIKQLKAGTTHNGEEILNEIYGEHYEIESLELLRFASNKNLSRYLKKQPRENLEKFTMCLEDFKFNWIHIPLLIFLPGVLIIWLLYVIIKAFNSKSIPYYAVGEEQIKRRSKKSQLGYIEEKGIVVYEAFAAPWEEERKMLKKLALNRIVFLVLAIIAFIITLILLLYSKLLGI